MFGLLKKLFSKGADAPPPAPSQPSPPPPAREVRPVAPASAPPSPSAARAAPAAPAAPAGESVQVNLRVIIAKLPQELKGAVARQPGGSVTVAIGLGTILPQLSQGSVKIPFAELRGLAPGGTFTGTPEQDQVMVDIPLSELLPKLKPEFLTRRANQKQVEVPADVTPLFGARGEIVPPPKPAPEKPAPAKPAPAAPPPPPAPAPVVAKPAPSPEPPPKPEPVAVTPEPAPPAPAAPPEPDAPIKPAFSLPDPASLRPTTPSAAPKPPTPAPLKPATPAAPKLPSASPAPLPKPASPPAAPLPKPAPTPTPTPTLPKPAPAPAPAAAAPVEGGAQVVSVALATAGANWPEPLKAAAASGNATIEIPFADADQAMKKGKVVFPWQRMREWIKPAPPTVTVADGLEVEIPLAVVAPAFMALRLPARAQKQVAVAANIPDLFTGKAATPTPTAAPAPAAAGPAPAPATAAPVSPLGVLFGQPNKTTWTPVDLVLKTAVLKGMSGALIATADGLLVAGLLPPGMKGETFAAFVPQIFNRTSQYAKEMNLGELSLVTLTVNQSSCQINKAGGVFFAALGKPGETLPTDKLALVLAELARQNQK